MTNNKSTSIDTILGAICYKTLAQMEETVESFGWDIVSPYNMLNCGNSAVLEFKIESGLGRYQMWLHMPYKKEESHDYEYLDLGSAMITRVDCKYDE